MWTLMTMYHSRPTNAHDARSAIVQVAHVARRVRRRISVADAARLFLELRDRCVVRLRRGGKISKHRAAALLARHVRRHRSIIELLVSAGDAHQRDEASWTAVVRHCSARD